jgi:hypothetical protein
MVMKPGFLAWYGILMAYYTSIYGFKFQKTAENRILSFSRQFRSEYQSNRRYPVSKAVDTSIKSSLNDFIGSIDTTFWTIENIIQEEGVYKYWFMLPTS